MQGLSVIVPCLNEAASLPDLVRRVVATLSVSGSPAVGATELILVDDGSRDGTWEYTRRLARDPRGVGVVAARHDRTQGIPAAWRTGLARATGGWICVLDADLQYQPEEIPCLWRAIHATGADIVQGVRAGRGRRRDARYLLSRGLNAVLNRLFDMSLRDNKSGFFLCRREVLADLLAFRGSYRHWQCFVMVAAHHRGYRIHQIDTPFHPRRAGQSAFGRLALRPTYEVMRDLVVARREYRPGRRP